MERRKPRLVILRGLPGSGKSTRARKEFPGLLHYEPDHLFCDTAGRYRFDMQLWPDACDFVRHLVDFALARREDVVVSDVFLRLSDLRPYRELALAHDATMEVYTCAGDFGNVHLVPVKVYREMQSVFEEIPEGEMDAVGVMPTDEQLCNAFASTNTSEPLCEGRPGLERFVRQIEILAREKERERWSAAVSNLYDAALDTIASGRPVGHLDSAADAVGFLLGA